MGLFDSFRKEEVVGSKMLVCSLDARFSAQINSDSQQYKRLYPATTAMVFSGIGELVQAIAQKYDVVHVLADVSPEGTIGDGGGKTLSGAQLMEACSNADVKVLWIASDNRIENYGKGFDGRGKKLNLVLTVRRLGPYFTLFLGNLLEKTSAGEAFGKAWNDLNPQGGDSVQPDTPECSFVMGRGKVVLKK
jgi:hypothetical protein